MNALKEVFVCVKESHQSVCRAILRSNSVVCYHCGALLWNISRGSGIDQLCYDFSDPRSGKTFVTERSPLAKQCLRHYVVETHNLESAKDTKKGLESAPGIAGTSVGECKNNQSVMSTGATNNKIPGIPKYNNLSLTSKSMRFWKAYNIGEGMDIEGYLGPKGLMFWTTCYTKEMPGKGKTLYHWVCQYF